MEKSRKVPFSLILIFVDRCCLIQPWDIKTRVEEDSFVFLKTRGLKSGFSGTLSAILELQVTPVSSAPLGVYPDSALL